MKSAHRANDSVGKPAIKSSQADGGYSLAGQGKGGVECERWISSDDVSPDPQPVGSQVFVANPFLEVGEARRKGSPWRDDRLGVPRARRNRRSIAATWGTKK